MVKSILVLIAWILGLILKVTEVVHIIFSSKKPKEAINRIKTVIKNIEVDSPTIVVIILITAVTPLCIMLGFAAWEQRIVDTEYYSGLVMQDYNEYFVTVQAGQDRYAVKRGLSILGDSVYFSVGKRANGDYNPTYSKIIKTYNK